MKGMKLNIPQLLVSLLGIAMLCLLPFAGYKLKLVIIDIDLFSYTALNIALNINYLMLILFGLYVLELCFSFSGSAQLSMIVGCLGLIASIVFMAALKPMMKEASGLAVLDKVRLLLEYQEQYHFLPDSIASAIPAEINTENVTVLKNYLMDGTTVSIGAWVNLFIQVIYIGCSFLGLGSTSSGRHSSGNRRASSNVQQRRY